MTRPTISLVTPWLEHPELIPGYERTIKGADEVIIVDNGSTAWTHQHLAELCKRHGNAKIIRFPENQGFGIAANAGLKAATGDILVCINNDVRGAEGWLEQVRQDVTPGTLCGVDVRVHTVDGAAIPYIDGWIVAGPRQVWESLGYYDTETYEFAYYEDADLSLRAVLSGFLLKPCEQWGIQHLEIGGIVGNTTSRDFVEKRTHYGEQNRQRYVARVRRAMWDSLKEVGA
jgi:GT2 family glycosyltransferase